MKDASRRKKSVGTGIFGLLLLALIAFGAFYFWKYTETKNELSSANGSLVAANEELETYRTNPEAAAQAEIDRIVEDVSKLYALPEDENPSVATVKDKSKLGDQEFFAKAENDDITLIYTKAKLALLYRPTTKQIVNVSTLAIEQTASNDDSTPAE